MATRDFPAGVPSNQQRSSSVTVLYTISKYHQNAGNGLSEMKISGAGMPPDPPGIAGLARLHSSASVRTIKRNPAGAFDGCKGQSIEYLRGGYGFASRQTIFFLS